MSTEKPTSEDIEHNVSRQAKSNDNEFSNRRHALSPTSLRTAATTASTALRRAPGSDRRRPQRHWMHYLHDDRNSSPKDHVLLRENWRRLKDRYLDIAFTIDPSNLHSWSGATSLFIHLEKEVQRLSNEVIYPYLIESGIQEVTKADAMKLVLDIAQNLKENKMSDVSLLEVRDELIARKDRSYLDKQSLVPVIFAAICWFTALVKPSAQMSPRSLLIELPAGKSGLRPELGLENVDRPIVGLLRSFGNVLPTIDFDECHHRKSELLHLSTLNFYSLRTMAKVNIEWTETLSSHLHFYPLTRTLCVYRFPTACALQCLGRIEEHCSNRILRAYYSLHAESMVEVTAFRREVLLSYRLIFGQHPRSRKLFNDSEAKRLRKGDCYDPLLDSLCGERHKDGLKVLPSDIWPASCLDSNKSLQEQDVYATDLDFPLLAERLLKIQTFNLRQSPSRMRDLWRDRRHPMQWYTFWAVLIIGGTSILLAVIQILLSAVQVAAAVW